MFGVPEAEESTNKVLSWCRECPDVFVFYREVLSVSLKKQWEV